MSEHLTQIAHAVEQFLTSLPPEVTIEVACKGRTAEEVEAAYQAGIRHFAHNYVQEAQAMLPALSFEADWHMIGHLQRNKAPKAIKLFNMIESVDSLRLAEELDQRCAQASKMMPILLEINSGREANKTGILPEDLDALVEGLFNLSHLHLEGLMTMGPRYGNPEESRSYFVETRKLFERLKGKNLPHATMRWLSMGMSNSYLVAIEEGANLIRIGTAIFGK